MVCICNCCMKSRIESICQFLYGKTLSVKLLAMLNKITMVQVSKINVRFFFTLGFFFFLHSALILMQDCREEN